MYPMPWNPVRDHRVSFLYPDESTLDQGLHEVRGSRIGFHSIGYIGLLYIHL